MKVYDVYIGYGDRPDAQEAFTHLEGFALGLGIPGFTSFEARGGWLSIENQNDAPPARYEIYEPVRVFRFILPETLIEPWSIQAFATEAKKVLDQQVVLVTVTDVVVHQV